LGLKWNSGGISLSKSEEVYTRYNKVLKLKWQKEAKLAQLQPLCARDWLSETSQHTRENLSL